MRKTTAFNTQFVLNALQKKHSGSSATSNDNEQNFIPQKINTKFYKS